MMERRHLPAFVAVISILPLIAACSVDMGGFAFVNDRSVSVRASTAEAVLNADGSCGADANLDPASLRNRPTAIAPGIGECDLVRLKAEPPTDVLIGDSGKGQREVQVLYSEPTGREIYLFVDNKLTRVIKPGQG
ncbi:MAG: hypothetical protein ACRCUE_21505 [Bosea sp. (in: a-proteobacteria)]